MQVYRSLDHGTAAKRCKRHEIIDFPADIQAFADALVSMQNKRHSCDYDPVYKISKTDVEADLKKAKDVVKKLANAPAKHKKAFSTFLVVNIRSI